MASAEKPFEKMPVVVGGRYGLSSKEFTPAMVKGVYDNLKLDTPKPKIMRLKHKRSLDMINYYQTLEQFRDLAKTSQIKIAKCCTPKLNDPIVAFYTKSKKIIRFF